MPSNHRTINKDVMRKLMMITTMLLLLVTTALSAQERHGKGGEAKVPFAELELTAEQQQKLKELRQEDRKKMEALRKANPEQRPSREEMKKLREESRAEMESILTPEQRTKLTELKEARKEAMANVDREALKADLKKIQEEARQVVSAARGQLDQFISEEDKVAIDRLRAVYATNPMVQKREKGTRGQRPDRGNQADRPDREAHKAAVTEWKEAHKADIAEAQALADKYAEEMARIREKLAPQMKKWEQQKRDVVESYLPEGMAKGKGRAAKGKKGKRGGSHRADAPDASKEKGQGRKAVGFLLMKS